MLCKLPVPRVDKSCLNPPNLPTLATRREQPWYSQWMEQLIILLHQRQALPMSWHSPCALLSHSHLLPLTRRTFILTSHSHAKRLWKRLIVTPCPHRFQKLVVPQRSHSSRATYPQRELATSRASQLRLTRINLNALRTSNDHICRKECLKSTTCKRNIAYACGFTKRMHSKLGTTNIHCMHACLNI